MNLGIELETSNGSAFPQRKSNSILRRLLAKPLLYWKQSVFSAAFGLALLYLTVLGFDGVSDASLPSIRTEWNVLACTELHTVARNAR